MSITEYKAWFLTFERFALGSFASEREYTAQFVSELHITICYVVATFSCSTLLEAIMSALECEHAHKLHHQAKGTSQCNHQGRGVEARITKFLVVEVTDTWWSNTICCRGATSAKVPSPSPFNPSPRPAWWWLSRVFNQPTVLEVPPRCILESHRCILFISRMAHHAAEWPRQPQKQQH